MPSETQISAAETLMSQEELGDMLAAVGNHEAKAATITAMEPGALYTGSRLSSLIADQQGRQFGAYPAPNTITAYCVQTFEPIGLVARVVNTSGKKEFGLTPLGQTEGKALAGHLLDFSSKHPETSLRRIFGMTHSKDKLARPPILRYQILFDLLTAESAVTLLEIVDSTQLDEQTVRNHITEMEQDGILSTRLITRPAVYRPISDGVAKGDGPGGASKELTSQIDQAVLEAANSPDDRLTKETVAQILATDREASSVHASVKQRMQKLQKMGVLEKQIEQASNERVVWLSPSQKSLAYEICDLIENIRLRKPSFTDEGISKGLQIMQDPAKFSALIEKSGENSPQASSVPFEEKAVRIIEVLNRIESANANQIAASINNARITTVSVNKALGRMRERGLVDIAVPRHGHVASRWSAVVRDSA